MSRGSLQSLKRFPFLQLPQPSKQPVEQSFCVAATAQQTGEQVMSNAGPCARPGHAVGPRSFSQLAARRLVPLETLPPKEPKGAGVSRAALRTSMLNLACWVLRASGMGPGVLHCGTRLSNVHRASHHSQPSCRAGLGAGSDQVERAVRKARRARATMTQAALAGRK